MEITQTKLNKFIIFIQCIIVAIFGSIVIGLSVNFNGNGIKLWFGVKNIVSIICFSTFLFSYLIVFGVLMIRLKTYFPNFYKMQKKRIVTVASLLIFSMISKIVIQSIYSVDEILEALVESLKQDTWSYPLLQVFSLCSSIILPLCVMTYSLMQSLTERKLMAHRYSHRSVLIEK